jgi:hypothetical protein
MNRLVVLFAIFFASHLAVGTAQATTYYVANAGNNANTATDSGHPFASSPGMAGCSSICAVVTLLPGDSVLFNRGDVWRDTLEINFSGTAGHLITYGAYGTGPSNPTITGSDVMSGFSNEGLQIWDKGGLITESKILIINGVLGTECNAQATGRRRVPFGAQIGDPIETYLKAAEDGSVAAQFVVGLAHLEGYCVEKNGLSAYYWLRVAEENSSELGRRSRALVEQLQSTVKTDEIAALEQSVAIAIKDNKLFATKRPVEFIGRSADSPPLRRII